MSNTQATLLLLFILTVFALGLEWPSKDKRLGQRVSSSPRELRPRTPADCPDCRQTAAQPAASSTSSTVVPYGQLKSRRGPLREKTIDTCGFACPNAACRYFNNTDPAVHALVGYTCTALARSASAGVVTTVATILFRTSTAKPATPWREFSVRRHTALSGLKTPAAHVAQVLHAVAEGLSPHSAARVFNLSESTIRSWIARAGLHSRSLHDHLMRDLQLTVIQLDELRIKVWGQAEAAWLPLALRLPAGQTTGWVACDARTKLIPAFSLGARTQAFAHQLVHEVAQRLAPGCVPVFSSDGLALYF